MIDKHTFDTDIQGYSDRFQHSNHKVKEQQMLMWKDEPFDERTDYLTKQLITYIGNKRALLGKIGEAIEIVKSRLGKDKLVTFDAFSGSGVVSRYLKGHSSYLISNDLEDYASIIGRCFLTNKSDINLKNIKEIVNDLNNRVDSEPLSPGFIEELYAPNDEQNITKQDRVFYTKTNARRLDNYRRMIDNIATEYHHLLLGPLLSKASVHANTSGVFKGFHKNRHTKIGQFGGSGSDALTRIKGLITVETPILSLFECDYKVFQQDTNQLAKCLKELDLVYLDPPYNQHPYGSNYFMLNLLVNYKRPSSISRVSGIPDDWKRSGYNVKSKSLILFKELLNQLDTKFLLISFNNEGFIAPEEMIEMLNNLGKVSVIEAPYNAYRGSRNFNNRSIYTTEYLFLVERR